MQYLGLTALRLRASFHTQAQRVFLGTLLAAAPLSPWAKELPGQTESNLSVSPVGSVVHEVHVPTVPGAAGLEPKLALRYAGGDQNVGLGAGWSLGGYSRISFGGRNWETDSSNIGITFAPDDPLFLDGERLIEVGRAGSRNVKVEFRKELDDATRVFADLGTDGYPLQFTLEAKAGISTTFVPGPAVQGIGARVPLVYLPKRTTDRSGNYLDWEFSSTGLDVNLTKVSYTGYGGEGEHKPPFAEISLEYEQAARESTTYVMGQPLKRALRLKSISSTTTASEFAAPAGRAFRLDLKYRDVDSAERFYLEAITQTGFDGNTLPPISMAHRPPEFSWMAVPALSLPAGTGANGAASAYQFGAVKIPGGPMLPGMVVSFDTPTSRVARTLVASAGGWTEVPAKASPLSFVGSEGQSLATLLLDVNADGLADLIQNDADSGAVRAFLQTDASWQEDARYAPPVPLSRGGVAAAVKQLDIDGDGRMDLLVTQADGSTDILLAHASGWLWDEAHALAPAEGRASHIAQLQCIGPSTLLVASAAEGELAVHTRQYEAAEWGPALPACSGAR